MTAVTFKAHLAECRQIVEQEPDDGWRDFTLTVLDRWRDEPDVNKAWDAILRAATSGGAEPLSPFPLIEWVLEQAKVYNRLSDEVIPQSANLETRAIAAAEKEWRGRRRQGNTNLAWTAAAKDTMARQLRADRTRVDLSNFAEKCSSTTAASPLSKLSKYLLRSWSAMNSNRTQCGTRSSRPRVKAGTPAGKNSRRVSHRDCLASS
jgi:hypothetical protein